MNENLQNAVTELITRAISTADQAQGFILSEIPEVIQQLLMWKVAESGIFFIVSIMTFLLIPLGVYLQSKHHKWIIEKTDGCLYIVNLLHVFTLILVFETFSLTWLQIWIAPKVYLIEYASELIK